MLKIVGKFLVELKEMVKDKNVNIEITDEALDWLVEKGFNKKMGARSYNGYIDKEIKRSLPKWNYCLVNLQTVEISKIDVVKDELVVKATKEVVSEICGD